MPKLRPLSQTKFINDANLVAYYPLDGNSNDAKGTNNGTDTNVTYAADLFSQSATYNGSSSKTIVSSNLGYTGNGDWTGSVWINPTSWVSGKANLSIENSTTSNRFSMYCIGSNVYFGKVKRAVLDAPGMAVPATGAWHHLVSTFNATTSKARLYLNGKYITEITSSGNGSGASYNQLSIGTDEGSTAYAACKMDDIAFFNKVFSDAEVSELYQGMTMGEYLGAGSATTKLLLHLNGNSADSSGNNNNGVETAITWVDGKFGKCASFNGSTSSISIGTTGFPSGSTHSTFSAWYNATSLPSSGGYAVLLYYGTGTTNQSTGLAFRNVSGVQKVYYTLNGADLEYNYSVTGSWVNLIGTYDGTNAKLYINGTEVVSGARTPNIVLGGAYHHIGSFDGSLYKFTGSIDEVIIENRAWSASEVKKYYTYSKGMFGIV